jgi:hypothetical protein
MAIVLFTGQLEMDRTKIANEHDLSVDVVGDEGRERAEHPKFSAKPYVMFALFASQKVHTSTQ